MSHNEVERIKKVYQEYQDTATIQAQWSNENPGNRFIIQERQLALKNLLIPNGFFPLDQFEILDVGCGSGQVLANLQNWGAKASNLYGIDLLPNRIAKAKQKYPGIQFKCGNAERLGYPSGKFDIVQLYTVFTSILDDGMAESMAHEIRRVLRPGGGVIWYDFRYDNPRNPNVRGIKKKEIQALFSGYEINLKTITLLPFLARRLGKLTSFLYPLFSILPWLRTHYVGLFQKPDRMNNNVA